MECPSCGHDNPSGSGFCGSCGIELETDGKCAVCQRDNPTDAQFCGNCGEVLRCPNCARSNTDEGRFCRWCQQLLVASPGVTAAGIGRRVAAYVLDIVLFLATLIIGYIIWWLFTLRHGQTPGKQLLGIRVIRVDGTASDWGWTFVREFVIKFGLFEVVGDLVTLGIASIIDLIWAFWDKDRQTLHDKIVKTLVVDDRVLRSRPQVIPAESA